jgi:hypothetical protein
LLDKVSALLVAYLLERLEGGARSEKMIDQAVAAIAVDKQVTVQIGFFGAN